jgi:hypothetical protein
LLGKKYQIHGVLRMKSACAKTRNNCRYTSHPPLATFVCVLILPSVVITNNEQKTAMGCATSRDLHRFDKRMTRQLKRAKTRMDNMSAGLNVRMDSVNTRMDSIQTVVNTRMDSMNAGLNVRMDSLNARFDAVDVRLEGLQADIHDVKKIIKNPLFERPSLELVLILSDEGYCGHATQVELTVSEQLPQIDLATSSVLMTAAHVCVTVGSQLAGQTSSQLSVRRVNGTVEKVVTVVAIVLPKRYIEEGLHDFGFIVLDRPLGLDEFLTSQSIVPATESPIRNRLGDYVAGEVEGGRVMGPVVRLDNDRMLVHACSQPGYSGALLLTSNLKIAGVLHGDDPHRGKGARSVDKLSRVPETHQANDASLNPDVASPSSVVYVDAIPVGSNPEVCWVCEMTTTHGRELLKWADRLESLPPSSQRWKTPPPSTWSNQSEFEEASAWWTGVAKIVAEQNRGPFEVSQQLHITQMVDAWDRLLGKRFEVAVHRAFYLGGSEMEM